MQEEIRLQMGAAQEAATRVIEETQRDKLNQVQPKNSTSDPELPEIIVDPAITREDTLKDRDRDLTETTEKQSITNKQKVKTKKTTQKKTITRKNSTSKKQAQKPNAEKPVSLVRNNIQKMEEEIQRQKMQALVEYKPQINSKEKEYAFVVQKGIWKKQMEQQQTLGEKKPKSKISSFNCLGVFRRKNKNKEQ